MSPPLLPHQRPGPVRAWRNRNPGNVRPVAKPDRWQGEVGLDTNPGGPFSIFVEEHWGWRAICRVLLTYQDSYKLRTVQGLLYRYAPPAENPTAAYVSRVCTTLGVQPTDPVDVRQIRVMRQLLGAIAAVEGGRDCPAWTEAPMIAGMLAAGLKP